MSISIFIFFLVIDRVVENTKKYICKAMVTVVDHLGSASSNLNTLIDGGVEASPTELRIESLKQVSVVRQNYQHAISCIIFF